MMCPIPEPGIELSWLTVRADPGFSTGYDVEGWEGSTWVLHAMYEDPGLPGAVTHDEVHRARIAQGLAEPLSDFGEVNRGVAATVTGIPFGFVPRPGPPWQRIRWSDYATRAGRVLGVGQVVPPGERWFPSGSWPVSICPPPEGSLDEVSLDALVSVLGDHSPDGGDTPCFAFYTPLATGDFDHPVLLSGPLNAIRDLVHGENPFLWHDFRSTPSNFWPHDRAWFAWTDWDLQGTKVSGSGALINAVRAEPELETITWASAPRRVRSARCARPS